MKVFILLVVTLLIEQKLVFAQSDWNYGDVRQWPGTCQTGKLQSPINLDSDWSQCSNFPPLVFKNFNGPISGKLINKGGHTVEVELEGENKPKMSGGGLKSEYTLASFHFHWDSEHTLDNWRYDMESHMVFYASQLGSLQNALSKNGVAVVATLYKIESFFDDGSCLHGYKQSMNIIAQNVPRISKNVDQEIPIKLSSLWDFISPHLNDFYRYQGSLTTPNCTEQVTWTVFAVPNCISSENYDAIRNIYDKENRLVTHNYRPLQSINNRKIFHNGHCNY